MSLCEPSVAAQTAAEFCCKCEGSSHCGAGNCRGCVTSARAHGALGAACPSCATRSCRCRRSGGNCDREGSRRVFSTPVRPVAPRAFLLLSTQRACDWRPLPLAVPRMARRDARPRCAGRERGPETVTARWGLRRHHRQCGLERDVSGCPESPSARLRDDRDSPSPALGSGILSRSDNRPTSAVDRPVAKAGAAVRRAGSAPSGRLRFADALSPSLSRHLRSCRWQAGRSQGGFGGEPRLDRACVMASVEARKWG